MLICLVFVVTHIPRVILACQAYLRAPSITKCYENGFKFVPPLSLVCLEAVSNLLILVGLKTLLLLRLGLTY